MDTGHKKMRPFKPAVLLVAALMLATAPIIFSGCASGGAISKAREIHSMTPCGMMMESMMGGGHADHGDDGEHHATMADPDFQPDPDM
jgi:hypothetical protein